LRTSPEIGLEAEDVGDEEPVDRQAAREQVLEELVPLLEAGLSPSQALDYWAFEAHRGDARRVLAASVGRDPGRELAGDRRECREGSGQFLTSTPFTMVPQEPSK
jgi:hypothetical protein